MKNVSPIIFAAVTGIALALSGCRILPEIPLKPGIHLIKTDEKLSSLSYNAEVTSKGKVYHCETLLRADKSVRRSWNWEENGKKHSYMEVLLNGKGSIVLDSQATPIAMTDDQADSLLFFSNLFLQPNQALTVVNDIEDSRDIASPEFRCCNVKMSYQGIQNGLLVIAKDTGLWSTLIINKQDGSKIRIQFTEYREQGDSYFPVKIVTDFNGAESTAVIRDIKFNSELADGLFELQTKRINIETPRITP